MPLRRKGLAIVALPMAGLLAAFGATLLLAASDAHAARHTRHAIEVKELIQKTQDAVADAGGYALRAIGSGTASGAEAYRTARARATSTLDTLVRDHGDPHHQREYRTTIVKLDSIRDRVLGDLSAIDALWGAAAQGRVSREAMRDAGNAIEDARDALLDLDDATDADVTRALEAEEALQQTSLAVAVGALAVGLLGGVVAAIILLRGLVGRIRRLDENARSLAEGRQPVPLDPGDDELGRLGRSFAEYHRRLTEERTRLELALDAASLLLWSYDPATRTFSYGGGAFNLGAGFAPQDLPISIEQWEAIVHPDDRAAARQALEDAAELGTPIDHEYRGFGPNGEMTWVSVTGRAHVDPETGRTTVLGILSDVTARKRDEQAVREAEQRFRQLTESIDQMFWMVTPEMDRTLYVSPSCESIFGYPAEVAWKNPAHWLEAMHPEDREVMLANLASERPEPTSDFRIIRPDGEVRWVRGRASEVRDGEGTLVAIAGTTEDITAWKQAQDAVLRAREEAEAANLAKSTFLSRMSHELRTPLNAIIGFSQLLQMDGLDAEQREGVGHIEQAGRHLLGLVNDVLDISRIEEGRMALSLEPVPLASAIDEAVRMIEPLALERRVRVRVEDGGRACVLADRHRLKQVLLNLLSNAVKYNRRDGEASVTWERRDGRVRISVRDTGPGISEEMRGRLFQPFDRLGADGDGVEGTGLGLTVSKRLVEIMGGEIGLDTAAGEGSTFWFDLAQAAEEVEDTPAEAAGPASGRAGGSVLYIEDNPPNRVLVERALSRLEGLDVHTAATGELGLAIAMRLRPSLVLLDLNLPDVPGTEVLSRLLADERTRDAPVVVISADATEGQIRRLLAQGARDYLTKPIDVPRLLAVVERLVPLRVP